MRKILALVLAAIMLVPVRYKKKRKRKSACARRGSSPQSYKKQAENYSACFDIIAHPSRTTMRRST